MPRQPRGEEALKSGSLGRLWRALNAGILRVTNQSTIMATFTATIIGTGVYIAFKDATRFHRMMDRFSRGNIIEPMMKSHYELRYFPRPAERKMLCDILRPEVSNQYYLVYGEVGSGKTRLILEVVRELMETDGKYKQGAPIYILASQGNSFPDSFASALNFQFDEHISFKFFLDFIFRVGELPKNDDQTKFERVLSALEKAAFRYLKKTGKPVVLVVDGVNWITDSMPGALERLQEKAKLWADTNIIKVIFVSNDEKTEEILQSNHSAWSRGAPPICIGDLSEKEARNYLSYPDPLMERAALSTQGNSKEDDKNSCVCNMPEEITSQILNLIGGRFQHLLVCKRAWLEGCSFQTIAAHLKIKERTKFVEVLRHFTQRKVIEILYNSPDHMMLLRDLVDETSQDDVMNLALENVIKIERDDERGLIVTFQSRLTEVVVEELMTQLQSKNKRWWWFW